ncbi:DUF1427 family protein [Luteibacter flocculans]|nr:DUF1427 family protein [Luteibacter flocculans]
MPTMRWTLTSAVTNVVSHPQMPWIVAMKSYLVSFVVGALVGVLYAALKVRSPAPPLVALTGLLGMVLGESGWASIVAIVRTALKA